ncbi:uncharacterized protein [Malus domestica]|uniref:uncharacterized protein n=1 Tax=Malus domestica TaxID=3750 RepID=UPI0010A99BF9|nr:uncharacterized protein LOC103433220 [Malus domestica]XP_008369677.2 uncharacterized protein LOC103433220 [Malus domestica]XP_028956912.1 uncharacterized protein LOC103433220 [Malus domestica]
MSDQHLRLNHLRSTSQLLRQATTSFAANLFTFVFLSLLIFSFRTVVENGTHLLTSFVDRDPSLKSLLSRLDLAGAGNTNHRSPRSPAESPSPITLRRRHRPVLHLTRVGTLDDDFFSGDDDDARSLFGPNRIAPILIFSSSSHSTSKLGFNGTYGTRVSEIVRSSLTFKAEKFTISNDRSRGRDGDGESNEGEEKGGDEEMDDRAVDLQFLINGLELGRRDVATLFFLVSFLSAAYGWVILGFLVTYSWVLGIVFTTVVNDLIGRFTSFFGLVWDGSRLGIKRLSGFILMRWAVRDALTQLLGLWYFGEIEDQYSFFKLFIRLKLMPFSVMPPWIRGYEKELTGFLFVWYLLDTLVAFVFAVDAWVAIVDSRKSGREIVKEGCYLMLSMLSQAIQIKCLESVLCGGSVRWVLTRICGRSFAKLFQSTVEVYFMVSWLIFYFAARARCRDASSQGERIGALD